MKKCITNTETETICLSAVTTTSKLYLNKVFFSTKNIIDQSIDRWHLNWWIHMKLDINPIIINSFEFHFIYCLSFWIFVLLRLFSSPETKINKKVIQSFCLFIFVLSFQVLCEWQACQSFFFFLLMKIFSWFKKKKIYFLFVLFWLLLLLIHSYDISSLFILIFSFGNWLHHRHHH